MVGELGRLPTPELERRSMAHRFPIPIIAGCLGEGGVRRATLAIVRLALADSPRFGEHAGCAVEHLGRVLNATQALAHLAQEDRRVIQGLVARALAACGAVPPLGREERSVT